MKKSLLFFAIAWATITMSSARAQSTLALQEKCSKAANDLFVAEGYKTIDKSKELGRCFWIYESHYNKKMDKCFILVSGSCVKNDENTKETNLADVFGNKVHASYFGVYNQKGALQHRICILGDAQFNMMNGREFNEQTKKWDIISEAYTNSLKTPFVDPMREKFDKWVKPYMEE